MRVGGFFLYFQSPIKARGYVRKTWHCARHCGWRGRLDQATSWGNPLGAGRCPRCGAGTRRDA